MTDLLVIDAEHPWPWLEVFPETAAPFFNGRDEDAETLLRRVLTSPVTVLFGKSGLGKSSLLQAGLFPLLREQRLLPVCVRLTYGKDDPCASEQIARCLHIERERLRASSTPLDRNDSRDPGDSRQAAKTRSPMTCGLSCMTPLPF